MRSGRRLQTPKAKTQIYLRVGTLSKQSRKRYFMSNTKKPLYNLSSFCRAYISKKHLYGVMLSGYLKTDSGTKYVNIYVGNSKNNISVKKLPDGSYNVTLNFIDCTIVDKDKDEQGEPTPPKGKSKQLQEMEENGDFPF